MKAYTIKNKKTGMYSAGGKSPKWSYLPKFFLSKKSLYSHINKIDIDTVYDNAIIELWDLKKIKDAWDVNSIIAHDLQKKLSKDIAKENKRKKEIQDKFGWWN